MTGTNTIQNPSPLSEKLSLVTDHQLLTRVPVKLDLDEWNYGQWEYFFDLFCATYGVDNHIRSPSTENSTPEEAKVDKIVLSWIFTTLSDSLRARLVMVRPKSAKEAWEILSDIVNDHKRSRTNALKAELRSIKLGDRSMESYFQMVDSIVNFLTGLDAHVNEQDVANYVLDGLPETYNQVCGDMHYRDTFPDLETVRALLIAEEMRLKSKSRAIPVDSSSSLMARSGVNRRPTTSQSKRPCFFFAKGSCRFGNKCRYMHDVNAKTNTSSHPRINNINTTKKLLSKSKENRQDLSKPVTFVAGCKRKHETEENLDEGLFTSTECAYKKVHQLKEMGNALKMMRKMGYKEGDGLGPNGQGIVNPIEVNTRPKFLGLGCKNDNKTANVTTLQKISDKNKALSLPSEKRKNGQDVDGLEVIVSTLDQLNNDSHSGNLSLELLGDSLRYLKQRFPDEFKFCRLSTIACSFVLPLFSRLFKGWDPLIKPADHIDVISIWKDLLQGDDINSPYSQLFIEAVFCAVNRSSTNTWQASNPEPLLHFLDIWELLTPQAALRKILATKHICSSRKMFVSYRKAKEPESVVMENGTVSKIEGKGKVVLKLTSGKDLVLSNVLHVPNIIKNIISHPILSNTEFKLVFELDKFIITKGSD